MERACRWPRRVISLLMVCMLSLGPFAQGVVVGLEADIQPVDDTDIEMPTVGTRPDAGELLSNIDGFFTENLGQKGEGAGLFYCQGSPLSVAFGEGWVAYDHRPKDNDQGAMFRVTFEEANPVIPVGMSVLGHRSNFFIGNDPGGWVTDVMNYREVIYPGIYDGIDLRYSLKDGHMKYDYIVEPGADPSDIVMRYDGVEGIGIDDRTGHLMIQTPVGLMIDKAPVAFQRTGYSEWVVPCNYRISEGSYLTFDVTDYDATMPLIIDPELLFSTYLGGSRIESPQAIDVDDDGNIVIVGETYSDDFPLTPGAYDKVKGAHTDAFITKLAASGSYLLFSTYLGGSTPITDSRPYDRCADVMLDGNGDIYLTGDTYALDFPTTTGAVQSQHGGGQSVYGYRDAFITKMNSSGDRLLYSTYLGGNGTDIGEKCKVDSDGNAYVYGMTYSSNFPVVDGSYDTTYNGGGDRFLAKLNISSSTIEYCTYIGGSDWDGGGGFHLDNAGCTYFTGSTPSKDFPTTSTAINRNYIGGTYDGFFCKMDANGSTLLYSTYFGGSEADYGEQMKVDQNGNFYLTGHTNSTDFPTTQGAYDTTLADSFDAFILLLSSTFDKIKHCSFIGGGEGEYGYSIDIYDNGTVHISGVTQSDDFPTTQDAYSSTLGGNGDGFYVIMDLNCSMMGYSTYFGGQEDNDEFRQIIVHDDRATLVANALSNDYPTTPGAYDRTQGGDWWDVGITQFALKPINGTPPSQPRNLSVAYGDRLVTLSWETPQDLGGLPFGGYKVFRGIIKDQLSELKTIPPVPSTLVDSPKITGNAYYYTVSGFNILGGGPMSEVIEVHPHGTPLAPQNLTLTPGNGSILFSWDPPTLTGGLPIIHYQIYRGDTRSEQYHIAEIDNDTEYKDTRVEIGHEYFYTVRGDNAKFNGTTSQPCSAIPIGPPTEPRSPFLIVADSQLTLRWMAPSNDGSRTIIGYRIFRGLTEDDLVYIQTEEGYSREFVDVNLTNGIMYVYAVQAFNDVGDSPLSSLVKGTPIGLPGTPLELEISASDGQVALEWAPPESDGGTDILGYLVFRGQSIDKMVQMAEISPEVTDYLDKDVVNGNTYFYTVRAKNAVGEGPLSAAQKATPMALPDAPGDLVVIDELYMVKIAWLHPPNRGGADIDGYIIYRGASEESLEPLSNVSSSNLTFLDTDAENGMTYFYAVSAVTVAGEGPQSIVVSATPYAPPDVPENLKAATSVDEITLSWELPKDGGGSAITGYAIMRGLSKDNLRKIVDLGPVTTFVDDSVVVGQTYHYAIAAVNAAGTSPYTEPISVRIEVPDTPPSRVTRLTLSVEGTTVTLQWSPPVDNGGSPLTGYLILRGLAQGDLAQVAEVGPSMTSWTDEGLEKGTTYYYSVVAKNDVGEGEPVAEEEAKVPKDKKEDSPGFEAFLFAISMMIIVPIIARRRD